MSSGAVCGAWLCLSQTIVLFSLMALNCCLLDQWSHLGQLWYWGHFSPMLHDPWLYFWNSFSRSLSCAHDAKCVLVQYGGRYLCLGLSPLANPAPSFSPHLLSESSALHLLLSDGSLQGKTEIFTQKPGTTGLHLCQSGSVSEEGCMGFLAAVFRRLWVSCFFPPCPPGFTDVSKGWCHWKSDHKLLG